MLKRNKRKPLYTDSMNSQVAYLILMQHFAEEQLVDQTPESALNKLVGSTVSCNS
jgi:hypothetical protein